MLKLLILIKRPQKRINNELTQAKQTLKVDIQPLKQL